MYLPIRCLATAMIFYYGCGSLEESRGTQATRWFHKLPFTKQKTNSVTFSLQANYTDRLIGAADEVSADICS
jgi:hypothetical protein